jgi:hypothetical protein
MSPNPLPTNALRRAHPSRCTLKTRQASCRVHFGGMGMMPCWVRSRAPGHGTRPAPAPQPMHPFARAHSTLYGTAGEGGVLWGVLCILQGYVLVGNCPSTSYCPKEPATRWLAGWGPACQSPAGSSDMAQAPRSIATLLLEGPPCKRGAGLLQAHGVHRGPRGGAAVTTREHPMCKGSLHQLLDPQRWCCPLCEWLSLSRMHQETCRVHQKREGVHAATASLARPPPLAHSRLR